MLLGGTGDGVEGRRKIYRLAPGSSWDLVGEMKTGRWDHGMSTVRFNSLAKDCRSSSGRGYHGYQGYGYQGYGYGGVSVAG